jgi:hypothetical protein
MAAHCLLWDSLTTILVIALCIWFSYREYKKENEEKRL